MRDADTFKLMQRHSRSAKHGKVLFSSEHLYFIYPKARVVVYSIPEINTTCNMRPNRPLTSVKAMAAMEAWRCASTATMVPRAPALETLSSHGAAAQNMRSCSSGPSLRAVGSFVG